MSKSGSKLLNEVVEFYQSLRFYQDNGRDTTPYSKGSFRTYFSRPRFRFEHDDLNMWKDGIQGGTCIPAQYGTSVLSSDGTRSIWKRFCEEKAREFDLVEVKPASGKEYVLALLLPGVQFELGLQRIEDPLIAEEIRFEDTDCIVVSGRLSRPGDIEVVIEKDSLLLRRVRLKDWFKQMQEMNIDEGVPDLADLPFSVEVCYRDIRLEEPPAELLEF